MYDLIYIYIYIYKLRCQIIEIPSIVNFRDQDYAHIPWKH